jgi:hypothetical protein
MKRECDKCGAIIVIDINKKLIESTITKGLCSECQRFILENTR